VLEPFILACVGVSSMRAIQKYDDELASESSDMMEQENQWSTWRKPLLVGVCAALVVAAVVVTKKMPAGRREVAQFDVIDLAASEDCSTDTENCFESRCCKNSNRKCYMKNQYWSNCNDTCDKGHVDAYDKEKGITGGWICKELKNDGKCANDKEDCGGKDGCCSKGHICYIKNKHWRNCNEGCSLGVGANKYERASNKHESWSCEIEELGQYCPDAKLDQASDPAEHLKCCKDTFCKGRTDKDCETKICAFYYNASATGTTTNAAGTTTAADTSEAPTTTEVPTSTEAPTTAAATTTKKEEKVHSFGH